MTVGDNWKGWTLESLIGEGSFGKVYKIVRKEFGHEYESALKIIRVPHNSAEVASIKSEGMSDASITTYYQGMIQDIVSEFALMSELKGNSNIVSYEDHEVVKLEDEFGWDIFVRMELLTPLFTYISEHTLSEKDVVKLGIDMCRALEICRQFNIIHRDIKPENIFVSTQGNFKLGDFGISKQLDKATVAMSKKGTYVYMAPEVYKGDPYDATVDMYSLAIVLYRFLNDNRTPFMPPASQPIRFQDKDKATVKRMSGEPIPPPCNAQKDLSEIILKACSFDPKDRYESPREMRIALEMLYPDNHGKPIIEDNDSDDTGGKTTFWEMDPNDAEEQTLPWDIDTDSDDEQTLPLDEVVAEEQTLPLDIGVEDVEEQTLPLDAEDVSGNTDQKSDGEKDESRDGESSESLSSKTKKAPDKRVIALIAALAVIAACAFGIHSHIESNKVAVPNVIGISEEEAKAEIESAELIYKEEREFSEDVDQGIVVSQSIDAKEKVKKETEIEVVVSRGEPRTAPRLIKYPPETAKRYAEEKGYTMEIEGEEYSDDISAGYVCRQIPDVGEDCEKGQVFKVYVSKGIEQMTVPDVTGLTPDKARPLITEAGLKMKVKQEHSEDVPSGQIIEQSPEAGEIVNHNSTVIIKVSIGSADVFVDE